MDPTITDSLIKFIQSAPDFSIGIKGRDERIPVHTIALKAFSKYFSEYFTSDRDSCDKFSIELDRDKDPNIIQKVVDFIHGKQVIITSEELVPFIKEGIYFDIPIIDAYCKKVFPTTVTPVNAYNYYNELQKQHIPGSYYTTICFENIINQLSLLNEAVIKSVIRFNDFVNFMIYLKNNKPTITEMNFMKIVNIWMSEQKEITEDHREFVSSIINLSNFTADYISTNIEMFKKYFKADDLLNAVTAFINTKSIRIDTVYDNVNYPGRRIKAFQVGIEPRPGDWNNQYINVTKKVVLFPID